MINKLLQIVAPHHCYGCNKTGTVLCENCKYDIISDGFLGCLVCARPALEGICAQCQTTYQKAWCVGERSGVLEALINGLKFERQVDAADSLVSLLDAHLPVLPPDTLIVPIPTTAAHVRQRGYDQTQLLAKRLAGRRNLRTLALLKRRDSRAQRGHTKKQRFEQAKSAFTCGQMLDPDRPYVLLDDVVTTNATIRFAAKALIDAGARTVWVAALARQPLAK